MYRVEKITTNPLQKHTVILPDGLPLTFELYFRPMQYGWFFNDITYQDFTLKGLRVTNNPNMLYQFQNLIPFGIGCFSNDNREPSFLQDFDSGASRLYILDESEVLEYTRIVQGG